MNPLVSVIIPVYNEEKYLSYCIESVLAQNYTNWECIILNNCSSDASLSIAKNYEKLDRRIKVYSNDYTLKQLENHNKSLKHISNSSKYCKMVLGDDAIHSDCIQKMVEVAESDPTVGIVGSYRLLGSKVAGVGLPFDGNPKEKNIFDGRDICKMHLLMDDFYLFGSQTSLLYKSSIVRSKNKFFDEACIFADADACYGILKDYNFGFINQVLSFSRIDNESLTSSIIDYRPALPTKLILLVKYGNIYLNKEEYNNRYEKLIKDYYDYLGWKLFTQKDKRFWEFHEKELEKLGLKINPTKLCRSSICYLIDKMLNPKRTIEEIINRKNRHKYKFTTKIKV